MGNLTLNLRVLSWHIQLVRGKWWPIISKNEYYKGRKWSDRQIVELYSAHSDGEIFGAGFILGLLIAALVWIF